MSLSRLLNTSAEVWRTTRVPDGLGGWVGTTSKVADTRCRVSQPSAQERLQGPQEGATLSHVVYLPPGADVRRGDQLRQAGRILDVLAVFEPSEPVYLRADCEQRESA